MTNSLIDILRDGLGCEPVILDHGVWEPLPDGGGWRYVGPSTEQSEGAIVAIDLLDVVAQGAASG